MKRLIDFDFSKWGQDGINVEVNGSKVAELHKHNTAKDVYFGHYGGFQIFCLYSNNFIMYQEIKPREFWINEYEDRVGMPYESKSDANENKAKGFKRQIKVREVLDDEQ